MNGKSKLRFEDEAAPLKTSSPKSAKRKRKPRVKKENSGQPDTVNTTEQAARVRPPAPLSADENGSAANPSEGRGRSAPLSSPDSKPKGTVQGQEEHPVSKLRFQDDNDTSTSPDDIERGSFFSDDKGKGGATATPRERVNRAERAKTDVHPDADARLDGLPIKPDRSRSDSSVNPTERDGAPPPHERSGLTEHSGERCPLFQQDQDSPDGLRFEKAEKKVGKLEKKADIIEKKLGKSRSKMPHKKVEKRELVFDEKKGKSKSKLTFEEKPLPIGEAKWNKPPKETLTHKAIGASRTTAVNKIHSKIYQVEDENAGTKVAHRAELMGESAYRGAKRSVKSAYRFVKNTPYRRAAKLEKLSIKNEAKLSFHKAVRDNPKLQSNPLSRLFQRRSIKRRYAASARNADKSVKAAKTAGKAAKKVSSAVTGFVRRNPIILVYVGIFLLIVILIMALFTTCMSVFSNSASYAGGMAYTAADTDIDNAELVYTQWETDLRLEIAGVEADRSGYDEYRYNIGEIGHDPLELMAYLTAVYDDFSYGDIESALWSIFAEQYTLEFIPETETRTRLETRMDSYFDPATGETVYYEYDEEVDYVLRILNVNLTVKPLTEIINPLMTADQRERYETLVYTNGARQYVGNPFDVDWRPYVTSNYGYRIHPITGERDFHKGIDIALPSGTGILARFDGTVVTVGYDADGYGNYVIIDNGQGLQARYAHCSGISVGEGQNVTAGSVIALVGITGSSTGPHLHMEVVKDGQHINPIYFLSSSRT